MENQIQKNSSHEQPIDIPASLLNDITKKRALTPSLFALAIVFFFFTFCVFRCGDQKIGSVTGINLVTGSEIGNKDLFTGRQTKGQEVPANVWAILAFVSSIIGLGVYLIKDENNNLVGTFAGAIGVISLIILQLVVKNDIDQQSHASGVDVDFQFPYYGALISLALGGMLSYSRLQKTSKIEISSSPPSGSKTSESKTIHQGQTELSSFLPSINFDLMNWLNVNGKAVKEWFNENKKNVMIVISTIIVLYGVYYFFLKNDPVNDAKTAAATYCDCSIKYNDAMINVYKDFLNSFNSYNFKRRQDARNKLLELQSVASTEYSQCNNLAQQKYNDLRSRYISEQEDLNKFDFAYNTIAGSSCNPPNQSKMSSLYSDIESKVNTIKDPEPDIEKIKADLIGQKIPGWNFDYLSEIKSIIISNSTHSLERIEYSIDLHMLGYTQTQDNFNDAQVMVTYVYGNDGWYFSNVREIYITYDNLIPSDNWATIIPLQNCSFTFPFNQRLSWKTYTWAPEIKTGPDAKNVTLPNSNNYLVRSREGHAVKIRITYRPIG